MSTSMLYLSRAVTCNSNVKARGFIGLFENGQCLFGARHQLLTTMSTRTFSTGTNTPPQQQNNRPKPIPNEALKQVKALGMAHLEATTLEVQSKTREPLFLPESQMGPTPDQLAEANRIYSVLTQVLERFSKRDATFSIKGEPIVIMEVEVSQDLRQARVYYSLPFSVYRHDTTVVSKVAQRMQEILIQKGGKLQRLVHAQLRSYYPPKLRFVHSQDDLFEESLKKMAKKSKKRGT